MKPIDPLGQLVKTHSLGYRDAFHQAVVCSTLKDGFSELVHACPVRFINPELTEFVRVNSIYDAHGILDPFLNREHVEDNDGSDRYWILIKPELAGAVAHHFDLNVPKGSMSPEYLKSIDHDDGCRGC